MTKRENSFPDLVAYLDQVERKPFQPGAHDCALFVAGAVEVQTGVDHAAAYRGQYDTVKGGLKLLAKAKKGRDHISYVAAKFNAIAPSLAQSGDLGIVDAGNGEFSLGVFCGAHIYVVTQSGLGILPRTSVIQAWEV